MKQPNWKTPLILSATLCAVGGFAYWLQYSHKPKKDKLDIATKKPIALTDDQQVAMIKIKSNRGLIELKCESVAEKKCTASTLGKWVISHPKAPDGNLYPADSSEVKDFLNTSSNAIASEVIDLSEDTPEKRKLLLGEYGLSDDKRANIETQFLELVLENGKRLTAWFGVDHPIGDKTFVTSSVDGVMNDKTVFLISNHNKTQNFTKTVTNFREKTLFTFDRKSITEFTAKVAMEKKNGGKLAGKMVNNLWTINGAPANFERVETVLSAIANAKAVDFVDPSLIKGMKPLITYDLKSADKSYSLSIYEKDLKAKNLPGTDDGHGHDQKLPAEKHYYAQTSESKEIFEVEAMLKTNLDKTLNDLRYNIFLSDSEKVTATSFKVEAKGYAANPEFTLVKGKWTAKDGTKQWDPDLINKLVDLFAITRVKDFVSPAPAGKESYAIAIGDDKNPSKFHYAFYTVKEKVYARNLNEKTNEALLMEDTMINVLPKSESEWKIKQAPSK